VGLVPLLRKGRLKIKKGTGGGGTNPGFHQGQVIGPIGSESEFEKREKRQKASLLVRVDRRIALEKKKSREKKEGKEKDGTQKSFF